MCASVTDDGYTGERGRQLIRDVARTGESETVEWRAQRHDGARIWLEVTLATAEIGGQQRVLSIQRDVTERKHREQRLEVFNRILRHNLRNQLDVIRSHAETLADRTDPDDDDHAERIVTAADGLAAMGARARKPDRIMSVDAGTSELSLQETLREVVETTATEHRVDVTTDLPESPRLRTNRETLRTAAKSALENAVEHADSTVAVAIEEHSEEYTIVIEDDGPGISEEELAPIEAGTEIKLDHGRGLGLWQLRWGVDKLNGELSFDTDRGTTIRISVPDRSDTARGN